MSPTLKKDNMIFCRHTVAFFSTIPEQMTARLRLLSQFGDLSNFANLFYEVDISYLSLSKASQRLLSIFEFF